LLLPAGDVDEKVLEYCLRASQNLDSLTFDEKRLLFNALEIKVIADRDHDEVRAFLLATHHWTNIGMFATKTKPQSSFTSVYGAES